MYRTQHSVLLHCWGLISGELCHEGPQHALVSDQHVEGEAAQAEHACMCCWPQVCYDCDKDESAQLRLGQAATGMGMVRIVAAQAAQITQERVVRSDASSAVSVKHPSPWALLPLHDFMAQQRGQRRASSTASGQACSLASLQLGMTRTCDEQDV